MTDLFIKNLFNLYLEAAPFLLLGLLISGVLHVYMPNSWIQRFIGNGGLLSVLKASLIGTPIPLCSCGVVPLGLKLYDQGVKKSAVMSFLIATPENGVDSLSLSYSLFGGFFTIIRVVFALIVANISGMFFYFFEKFGMLEKEKGAIPNKDCCQSKIEPMHPHKKKPIEIITFITNDFLPEIAVSMLLGFLLSAFISTVLPTDYLSTVPSKYSIFAAAMVGIPLYVCASASTPIAYGLMLNGLSMGACLTFLLTGPVTNSSNVPIYIKKFGLRSTLLFYISIFITTVSLGFLVDTFIPADLVDLSLSHTAHNHSEGMLMTYFGTIGFSLLYLAGLYRRLVKKN